jgi:hypothetical protein
MVAGGFNWHLIETPLAALGLLSAAKKEWTPRPDGIELPSIFYSREREFAGPFPVG